MKKLIFYVLMSSSSCDFQHWTLLFFLSRVIHFFICCCWCSLLVASWLPHIRRWQAKEKVLCTFECVCLCVLGIFFLIGFPHPSTPPTQPGAGNSEDLSLQSPTIRFLFFFSVFNGSKIFLQTYPHLRQDYCLLLLIPCSLISVWAFFGFEFPPDSVVVVAGHSNNNILYNNSSSVSVYTTDGITRCVTWNPTRRFQLTLYARWHKNPAGISALTSYTRCPLTPFLHST